MTEAVSAGPATSVSNPVWSAAMLDPVDDAIHAHIERSLPVRLIATLGRFTAAFADEPVATAMLRAEQNGFDHMPVLDQPAGVVVGLFNRKNAAGKTSASVREVMEPICGAILISADAPLQHFLMHADTAPCRLVLEGTEIRGLVTLSDIQRLPVRAALFAMFIHLELLLTDLLRDNLGADEALFDQLEKYPAKRARNLWKKAIESGMDRDVYSAMMFSDKIVLAQSIPLLVMDKEVIGRELSKIEQVIRHPIAHGKSFAMTSEQAVSVAITARSLRVWIDLLQRQIMQG